MSPTTGNGNAVHLFLDANAFLSLYGLPPEQVEELCKLPALVTSGKLKLWLPENVKDEFDRNREKVITEVMRNLRDSRLQVNVPKLAGDIPQAERLMESVRITQKQHSELIEFLEKQATERKLRADIIIEELFKSATLITTSTVIAAARVRSELRRPPGKTDSIGDAVNWESLLSAIPMGKDLHIVSSDNDFISPLFREEVLGYLREEWRNTKGADVVLYTSLERFLSKHFTAIKLPSDIPKVALIEELIASTNFNQTHKIVAQLRSYDTFTPEQASMLARGAVRNQQVRWIAHDPDVHELLSRIIDSHRGTIGSEIVGILENCMTGEQPAYGSVMLEGEIV